MTSENRQIALTLAVSMFTQPTVGGDRDDRALAAATKFLGWLEGGSK